MQSKRRSDVTSLDEVDYIGRLASTGALPSHLLARIARRPGRWRRKMNQRAEWSDAALPYLEDAA